MAHGGVGGRALHASLVAVFAAGLGLVAAAPWAAHRGGWAAPLLYAVFDPVCHQIAERSFHLWNEPLAVCHRCTGLYLGFTLGILIWPFLPRAAAARLLGRPRWILAFSAPLAIDVLLVANSAGSRVLTGLVAAFPVALLALAAAAQLAAKLRPPSGGRSGPATSIPPPPVLRLVTVQRTPTRRGSAPGDST